MDELISPRSIHLAVLDSIVKGSFADDSSLWLVASKADAYFLLGEQERAEQFYRTAMNAE